MEDLEQNWRKLYELFAPSAFRAKPSTPILVPTPAPDFDYLNAVPPQEIIHFHKQAAKRYHGVHGYFTRQVWSVVQKYIETFTRPGDLVLDPFGGSGVTLIEALILGRKAVHVDINPLANFIVDTEVRAVDLGELTRSFNLIVDKFEELRPRSPRKVAEYLKKFPYPKNVKLPENSDVPILDQLFTKEQLAELALLKSLIMKVRDNSVRAHLLLMFSGLLNKINLTYHASEGRSEGRGDSGIFRYYRYRIAHESPRLDPIVFFKSRFKKIAAAKAELKPFLSKLSPGNYILDAN
jgi:hypothetical protein